MFRSLLVPTTAQAMATARLITCACAIPVIVAWIARNIRTSVLITAQCTVVAIIRPVIARALWAGLA